MWLLYPISQENIRDARRGVLLLLFASALWYVTLAAVLTIWSHQILHKVFSKFAIIPDIPKSTTPFLVLLIGFTLAGGLRLLAYRLSSNIAWAVGAGDALNVTMLGALVWLAACGSVYFGFSGFLGIIPAVGTMMEQRLIRYAGQVFGLVVSQRSVRQLTIFFYARLGWCAIVFFAGMAMLFSHAIIDWPRPENAGIADGVTSPTAIWVNRYTQIFGTIFNILAVTAVVTLPLLTAGYWIMMLSLYNSLPRLLDPNGPSVPMLEADKPGFNQLKNILQNPF
jgi:hypothetical protein